METVLKPLDFENLRDTFSGVLLVTTPSYAFINKKMREHLMELKIDYSSVDLMQISDKLLSFLDPGFGVTLYVLENGIIKKKIDSIDTLENIKKFLEL